MTEAILTGIAAVLFNGAVVSWVYKVMQSNIENQRLYFEREVKDLRAQIDTLRNSESRWIQKYKQIYEHFRTHKGCSKSGECSAWSSYLEKINNDSLL